MQEASQETSNGRCHYFSLSTGTIHIPGLHQGMRVPVCRCALTEVLVSRLHTTAAGQELASFMEGSPLEGQPRPIIGSDLQPITAATCLVDRCRQRCIPGFVRILTDLSLDAEVPPETPSAGG